MSGLPRVSVIVPTLDRPKDLAALLRTIIDQRYSPIEVIIVDDSPTESAKQVAGFFSSAFESIGCKLKYVKGRFDGLPAARNLGVKLSAGDAILFLDDDALLSPNVVGTLATFLKDIHIAVGVQPRILPLRGNRSKGGIVQRFGNAANKALLLTYYEKDKLRVRRSGSSIFPHHLTKAVCAQRLFGCCCCYRRDVFSNLSFDVNLKRWGFMEDLDFSYRVHKIYPRSVYAIPDTKVVHRLSREAKLPTKLSVSMQTIYWFYVFFKDIFEVSMLNLIAFLWALTGNLIVNAGGLIIKRKTKREWWSFIYLLGSYIFAFKHLRSIRRGNLEFFNRTLPL